MRKLHSSSPKLGRNAVNKPLTMHDSHCCTAKAAQLSFDEILYTLGHPDDATATPQTGDTEYPGRPGVRAAMTVRQIYPPDGQPQRQDRRKQKNTCTSDLNSNAAAPYR
ncbi:hypothetical protein GCM10027256_13460 [Novispirillum itersonii subsp. nipponicum]